MLVAMAGLFAWNRAEANADRRQAAASRESDKRDLDGKIDAIRELTYAIHLEMKDFHSRLYMIEERNKIKIREK